MVVKEVAVVQCLQAQVRKGAISFGAERPAQRLQVEAGQLRRKPLDGDPVADVMCETIRIDRAHLSRPEEGVCQFFFHDFVVDNVQKQPGGHIAIIGLFKDQRTSGVHLRPPALHGRHAREDGFCDGFFQLRKGDAVELIERRREEAGEICPGDMRTLSMGPGWSASGRSVLPLHLGRRGGKG